MSIDEVSRIATPTQQRNSRGLAAAVTIGLALSVALNVLLAHRVRSLTDAQSAKMAEYQLKVGATVPPITAKRLGAEDETISYQGASEPTVLYVFTPPCSWCARNIDNFKTLLDKESSHYRFVGLSLSEEGLTQYIATNDLKLPVYSSVSTEARRAYKLSGTPQTIVVSPEGRVLQNWVGAYVGEQKSQIEAFFHLTLPGLRIQPGLEDAKQEPLPE